MDERLNVHSGEIIGGAIEVHRKLGPGLLESVYRQCMMREVQLRGLSVSEEVPVNVAYKGLEFEATYRMDLVVENSVVIELKVVERLLPVHEAQLLSYLRLSGSRLGLLINFHVTQLRAGVRRVVNGL